MSGALFARPVELTSDPIELHVRSARTLREAFRSMARKAVDGVRCWPHRPPRGGVAAGAR